MDVWTKICDNSDGTDFDAVLVLSPVNRRYLTNFPSTAGYVLVTKDTRIFITDFRYYGAAKEKQKNGIVPEGINIVLQDSNMWSIIKSTVGDKKNILVEEDYLTLDMYDKVKQKLAKYNLVDGASKTLANMRAVKSEAELENIVRAQKITDMAFEYIVGFISDNLGKPALTESRTALELEYYMRLHGADGIAFDTIAVSGKKSAMPHGVPEDKVMSKGFLTMDFGATYNGYCSDMTRTVCIGKPDEKMKDVYDAVLGAQLEALEYISAGKSGKDIDSVARKYIAKRGYDGTFGHALGHSLGLEIHENPTFSPSCSEIIKSGAVLSVEPGIYIDGNYGVRIEDIVNITETGCKNLTKSSKELIIL